MHPYKLLVQEKFQAVAPNGILTNVNITLQLCFHERICPDILNRILTSSI